MRKPAGRHSLTVISSRAARRQWRITRGDALLIFMFNLLKMVHRARRKELVYVELEFHFDAESPEKTFVRTLTSGCKFALGKNATQTGTPI